MYSPYKPVKDNSEMFTWAASVLPSEHGLEHSSLHSSFFVAFFFFSFMFSTLIRFEALHWSEGGQSSNTVQCSHICSVLEGNIYIPD